MKKLITVLCMALMSCEHSPKKPFMVVGYKTSRVDGCNYEREYRIADKSNYYYYFTDIINCSQPSKYTIGDTLK